MKFYANPGLPLDFPFAISFDFLSSISFGSILFCPIWFDSIRFSLVRFGSATQQDTKVGRQQAKNKLMLCFATRHLSCRFGCCCFCFCLVFCGRKGSFNRLLPPRLISGPFSAFFIMSELVRFFALRKHWTCSTETIMISSPPLDFWRCITDKKESLLGSARYLYVHLSIG